MHISTESIKNISNEFEDFFEDIQGGNYSVAHGVISFAFSEGFDFTKKDLYSVMKFLSPKSRPVEGLFNQITFFDAEKEINRCLTFNPYDLQENIPRETADYLIKTYWDLVKKHFIIPAQICYQYQPSFDKCFDFGIMWNFCFILLNDRGQGIILHAGAAD